MWARPKVKFYGRRRRTAADCAVQAGNVQLGRSVLAVAAAGVLHGPALASELGGSSYPIGVNNVLSGILPPPGEFRFYNYYQNYSSNEFAGPNGNSRIPGYQLNLNVDALRPLYTWAPQFGAFTITSGIVIPIVNVDLKVGARHEVLTGLGDIGLQPLLIGWKNAAGTLFINGGPNVYLPTGKYDANRLANTGRNSFAFWPTLNVTWMPSPRLEASAGSVLEFNARNPATRYRTGDEFDTEFEVTGVPLAEYRWLHIGLNGYVYRQFSDDRVNGADYLNGDRGSTNAIGPIVRCEFGRVGIVFKYQHEFDVRNRPTGDRLWVQFTVPLNGRLSAAPSFAPPVEK
ncbi:SphA family protein [Paraburkholderia megapolitana]|uniref:Uncharacterized conserved protein n=1 Tax=Paraburkholderia megapolitana TaxID=420953 RepID=A0A1I3VZI1_9BURK|nr:transporter [Paraburkholderia megapolitana]QDQ82273.1 phenol degradation protein meta [Paraburkholderia megapolitana]SFJ99747.1 Uncharacterized conserved protein [Paraburkholderia megapolitana]